MSNPRIISIPEIETAAYVLAITIGQLFKTYDTSQIIKLFGVPRGGIPAAFAVAAQHNQYLRKMRLVELADDADVIIDDLIDSGATKEEFNKSNPHIPFLALFTKKDSSKWYIFPWEALRDENKDSSATDIPLRLLQFVGEDSVRGGLIETPERFLKAWKHFTSGYDKDPAEVMKVFEDGADNYDEMVLIKNIPVYSQCEHHLVPFFGIAHIAYIPDGKIVGLSKLSRVVDIFARRLQVQERLTNQVADSLDEHLKALGVAVVIECRHLCMESRGISQQGQITSTSAMRGVFRDNQSTRAEFMSLIKA